MGNFKYIIFLIFIFVSDVCAQGVLTRLYERLDQLESKLQESEAAQKRALQQLERRVQMGRQDSGGQDLRALDDRVQNLSHRMDRVLEGVENSNQVAEKIAKIEDDMKQVAQLPEKNKAVVEVVGDLRDLIQDVVMMQKKMQAEPAVKVGGQVRPRYEARDAGVGQYDMATTMRVRTHVAAQLHPKSRVYIEFQDVRTWGEEQNTLTDYQADHFDLHQGYFEIENIGHSTLSMRVGRQAIALGGQRLVGAVEWTQQGRAFDGLRLTANLNGGRVDLIGLKLAEASLSQVAHDAYLFGVYQQITKPRYLDVDLYALYNREASYNRTNQFTLGSRLAGKFQMWDYRVEGAYQFGKRTGLDVGAFMLAGRLGVGFGNGRGMVALWYDYLSGDSDLADTKTKVFDTLFATNHKFYGYADLFLNIPVHTAQRGLQDVALKMMFKPTTHTSLGIDIHAFWVARRAGIASGTLGQEIDVTLGYHYSSEISFVGGYSYVFAGDGMRQIGALTKDAGFGYVMTTVDF